MSADEKENDITHQRLLTFLDQHEVHYQLTQHEPVLTSQQAADVRQMDLDSGAKAMLLRDSKKDITILVVMSASRKINWKKLKKATGKRNLRFANQEELLNMTGCLTGAVPPFGSIFHIQTILDQSLIDQGDSINFNAGLRTHSICMQLQDYLDAEEPTIVQFT